MGAEAGQYGPSSGLVEAYLEELAAGIGFHRLGEPDERDGQVVRIYDWLELGRRLDCGLWVSVPGPEGKQTCCLDPEQVGAGAGLDLKEAVWGLEPREPDSSPFVEFLEWLAERDGENTELAEKHGLAGAVQQAVDAACRRRPYHGEEDYFELLGAIPEGVTSRWEYTVEGHCAFIATELVVAHLSPPPLFREMWYWYRRGHWPCGWQGPWPEGRLIVF